MDYISLSQLTTSVKQIINRSFPMGVWVKAEISQMNVNQSSGHCYLSLIEKDPRGNSPIAKLSANIWRNNFERIRMEFEQSTSIQLRAGIEVVAQVMVDYSPIYGLSANIIKIDPTFNMGQLAKQRLENIAILKSEGIFNMNKELDFPSLPFRIAVVSSVTAAGYEDFIHQLNASSRNYTFKTKLFHCLMQGEKSPESMLDALDEILDEMDNFDCVVIIRGGGASSDLLAFDDLDVARVCAQFPLPILVGIGHTRDESILDMVANKSLKTPTAVASFLIENVELAFENVEIEAQRLNIAVNRMLERANMSIMNCANRLPQLCVQRVAAAEMKINNIKYTIDTAVSRKLMYSETAIANISNKLLDLTRRSINKEFEKIRSEEFKLGTVPKIKIKDHSRVLELLESKVDFANPINILNKGFTYTECNGKTITSAKNLNINDEIITYFSDGNVVSVVK